jgi:hypothetical protein
MIDGAYGISGDKDATRYERCGPLVVARADFDPTLSTAEYRSAKLSIEPLTSLSFLERANRLSLLLATERGAGTSALTGALLSEFPHACTSRHDSRTSTEDGQRGRNPAPHAPGYSRVLLLFGTTDPAAIIPTQPQVRCDACAARPHTKRPHLSSELSPRE